MDEFDYKGFAKACGLKKGDVIDVISDMRTFLLHAREKNIKFNCNKLIDTLCAEVGPEGTVLIRVFNWDFCGGKPFDMRSTPSRVGSLGNAALKREDFKRTRHPLYSWMVWGKQQSALCSLDDHDGFGTNSVFAWEQKNPSYALKIGDTETNGMTITHMIEEQEGMPFRYEKQFYGKVTDDTGVESGGYYSMYVHDLSDEYDINSSGISHKMETLGIKKKTAFDGIVIEKHNIPEYCTALAKDYHDNFPGTLYYGMNGNYRFFPRDLRETVAEVVASVIPDILKDTEYLLVDKGVLSKTDIDNLSAALEKKFEISIEQQKRTREYFNNWHAIATMVGWKLTEKHMH